MTAQDSTTQTVTYLVTGMTCSHCENAVRAEVGAVPGVTGVDVSATDGRLAVRIAGGATVTDQAVLAAVDEAGYTAVPERSA